MPFRQGTSGNPTGRPKGAKNKASRELKEFWREFFDSADYRESLKLRVSRGKAPHMELALHHYVFGKPKDTVQVEGTLTTERVTEVRAALAGRIARISTRLGSD